MGRTIGFGFIVLGTIYLVAAGVLARQRRSSVLLAKSITATVFTAAACLCSGLAYLQESQGLAFNLPYKARTIGTLAMPALLGACFDVQKRQRIGRVLELLLYAMWGGIFVLCVTGDLVEAGALSLVPFVDRVGRFEQAVRTLLAVTLLWSIFELVRTHRSTHGLVRRQTAYMLVGIGTYAGGAIATSASAVVLGRGAVDPALTFLFSVPWIGLTLYAASRYRLFDVRHLFGRTASGMAVVALATVAGWGVYRLTSPHIADPAAAALAVGLVSLPLVASGGLRSLIDTSMSRLLGEREREEADRRALDGLTTQRSFEHLVPQLVEAAMARLGTTEAALFLRQGREGLTFAHGRGLPEGWRTHLPDDAIITTWLERERQMFITEEQRLFGAKGLVASVEAQFAPMMVAVAAPIAHGDVLHGVLLLGPKANRDAFTRDDLDWLHALAGRASLAVENIQLYTALDDAVADLDLLIRSAAHDLRSPLRAIDNLARFAKEDLAENPGDVPAHLAAIRRRAVRMEALLDGVEDYLRTRAGNHTKEVEVDLTTVVEKIVGARVPSAFATEVCIDVGRVTTDVSGLTSVLDELVVNAVRHHDRDTGSIGVFASREGDRVAFRVVDDGPGIEPAYQGKIFQLFQTLERRDVTEYAGIGLAICKKVVHHAGSPLEVSSSGRGTTFRFTWPVAREVIGGVPR